MTNLKTGIDEKKPESTSTLDKKVDIRKNIIIISSLGMFLTIFFTIIPPQGETLFSISAYISSFS